MHSLHIRPSIQQICCPKNYCQQFGINYKENCKKFQQIDIIKKSKWSISEKTFHATTNLFNNKNESRARKNLYLQKNLKVSRLFFQFISICSNFLLLVISGDNGKKTEFQNALFSTWTETRQNKTR